MDKSTASRFILATLMVVLSQNALGAVATPTLGTNLHGITNYDGVRPFKDLMKSSGAWLPQVNWQCASSEIPAGASSWDTKEAISLDANGWPKATPTPTFCPTVPRTIAKSWGLGVGFPADRYVVLYDGEGTLSYSGDLTLISSTPGRDVLDIHSGNSPGPTILSITSTDPNNTGNYIRNIRLVPERFESDYQKQPFHPDFLNAIRPYHALRFMDWMNTNGTDLSSWANRPKPTDHNYMSNSGVPVETMIALANTLDQHAWFTLPHKADDNFVREFARLTLQNLDTDQNVYVEYSNEVWNGMFPQTPWVLAQAKLQWPTAQGFDWELISNWFGKRTSEICDIWKSEWGTESNRVVCVMGAQATGVAAGEQRLTCPLWSQAPCDSNHGIDAIAIAPYFGNAYGQSGNVATLTTWSQEPDGGLTSMFNEINTGTVLGNGVNALASAYATMDQYTTMTAPYNVPVISYEGGQHLVGIGGVENNTAITNLFHATNRDLRMGQVYTNYLNNWNSRAGGLFMHFLAIGPYSKWGSWGALEDSTHTSSAKHDALMAYLGNAPGIVDADYDGVPDASDNCPVNFNPGQEDANNDTIGDVCDTVSDSDGDTILDASDNCPGIVNPGQEDADNDGIGDVCDTFTDSDRDSIADASDNCPVNYNPGQEDADNDGIGDICDPLTDSDGDGVADAIDNCPADANPGQADSDGNGVGDACEVATPPTTTSSAKDSGSGAMGIWFLLLFLASGLYTIRKRGHLFKV